MSDQGRAIHTENQEQEFRATALMAAASSWAGISSMGPRDAAILRTAEIFQAWLTRPHRGDDQ